MSMREIGTFTTPNASKYLQQLCKHFAHKVDVEYDETRGKAQLPPGPAVLTAEADALRVEISAESDEGMKTARHIIDDHLARFAFREDFAGMEWVSA
ncbi:MAG: DUF2218 domain-containing protein [Rhodobacteraceae bacterium]|jgi:hypothetical protein|uniref:Uncharacterized protein n=1 Tax=Salipiger profundus TaxID=1229727 RepID=A0A1U7D4N5_9RHOB|nr:MULTISPECIES: DUF2218 domain-containing protein [Salipiger]APX23036.1 hypothetical protein Ga0080559_TMP2240 [Salipiger profundus]MAB04698.1 DUF2218 domain-containing protein [Paracoccaceae bacterium]GGA12870.1 hypothetical protein GCM10011326_26000 [Salipiger profundus]SFD20756.1 hypothetical protein SAMN05444415_108187 [Salipiger profundus]